MSVERVFDPLHRHSGEQRVEDPLYREGWWKDQWTSASTIFRATRSSRRFNAHKADLAQHSPPESCHALDLDGLRAPEVTFWSVWGDDGLMGFGALKELDATHGEIKSMRTLSGHVRKGVAARLMRHILQEARRREYRRLSLETGSMEVFEPARVLYERFGFEECDPFADYVEDPYSVYMTIVL